MTTATVYAVAEGVLSSVTDKKKFENDGSFDSVSQMIKSLAYKFYKRVQAINLPMDYEDVYQELCLSYVQAEKAWNPEGGAKFITYFTYSAQNNFNAAIRKMERDRVEMGMFSTDDFESEDEDGKSVIERMASAAAPETSSPDYWLMRESSFNKESMDKLSKSARKFIGVFIKTQLEQNAPDMKLSEIAKQLKIEGADLKRLKVEMFQTYGVKWL